MKKRLLNKAGVTVLEGVIALGLLALVMAGAFGVLLSSSRQTNQSDIREETVLAVERAKELLKAYVGVDNATRPPVPTDLRGGVCTNDLIHPLAIGTEQSLDCLLPPICDRHHYNESSFTYTVDEGSDGRLNVTFSIICRGYQI